MEENRKDRETLKTYFQSGKVPSEAQFGELIDSVPNIKEEGLCRNGEKGWIVCPVNGQQPAIGFYQQEPESGTAQPVWLLTVNPDDTLELRNAGEETLLTVSQDKVFTLNDKLKVNGEIIADSFTGNSGFAPGIIQRVQVPADKKWHDLPVEAAVEEYRSGCRVYRVWACYQNAIQDSYRTTEAVVQQCNGMDWELSSPRKHWWGWSGDVRLRWKLREGKLYLQIRSKSTGFRNGIHCQIKSEWSYTVTKE